MIRATSVPETQGGNVSIFPEAPLEIFKSGAVEIKSEGLTYKLTGRTDYLMMDQVLDPSAAITRSKE